MAYDRSKVFQPQPAGTSTVLAGNESDLQKKEQGLGSGIESTSGGSVTGGSSSQANQNKPSSTASKGSGSFTNLQSYISKNQPQAQKTADTLARSSEGQAAQVGQAIQSKQNQANQIVQSNQSRVDTGFQQANKAITDAGTIVNPRTGGRGTTATPKTALTDTGTTALQNFTKGNLGLQEANLDLFNEQQRTQALQSLARKSDTQEGLGQMLTDTIGKNRQYTQGQSSLDKLIVGGTQPALASLKDRAMAGADALQGTTRQAMDQFQAARGAVQADLEGKQKNIGNQLTTGLSGISSTVEQRFKDEKAKLTKQQQDYVKAFESGKIDQATLNQLLPKDYVKTASEAAQKQANDLARNLLMNQFGVYTDPTTGQQVFASGNADRDRTMREQKALINKLIDESGTQLSDWDRSILSQYGSQSLYQALAPQLTNVTEQQIQQQLLDAARKGNLSYDAANLSNLKSQDFMTAEELAKYQGLAKLAGKSDLQYLPEYQKQQVNLGGLNLSGFNPNLNTKLSKEQILEAVKKANEKFKTIVNMPISGI